MDTNNVFLELTLNTKVIFIRGGELVIGEANNRWNGKCAEVRLHGTKFD